MKRGVCCIVMLLVSLAWDPPAAVARVRALSSQEADAATGGYDSGACVVNGPCTADVMLRVPCDAVLFDPAAPLKGVVCKEENVQCAKRVTSNQTNITCTDNLGSGCEGSTLPGCATEVVEWCEVQGAGTVEDPFNCICVPDPPANIGNYDWCTPYAN